MLREEAATNSVLNITALFCAVRLYRDTNIVMDKNVIVILGFNDFL